MGAAAGAAVISGNFHDPHIAFQRLFTPIVQCPKGFCRRNRRLYRYIFQNSAIGFFFDSHHLLPGQFAVDINRNLFASHMKPHIIVAVFLMDQTGHDMFAPVILHVGITEMPVKNTADLLSFLQRPVGFMKNTAVGFMGILHHCLANKSPVSRLSAALRKKCRPVQFCKISAVLLCAFQNSGFKFPNVGIGFK